MTEKTEGKGRPTPKRSQRAKSYVAPPPTNRREAAKALRARQAQERKGIRTGSRSGVESAFLKRDRGPVRSYVRDVVDSQRSLGPILLPFMVVVIGLGFTNNAELYFAGFVSMLALIVVVGLDMVRLGRHIGRKLDVAHPGVPERRKHIFYGLQRTTLVRRFRNPPCKVAVGAPV